MKEKTLGKWILRAREALEKAGDEDARADARLIALDGLDISVESLPERRFCPLSETDARTLDALLERRLSGEPTQYALGRAWFMGFPFFVDRRVLIPRQDTETLVEAAVSVLGEIPEPKVLDLCAGSGAIGLSIAKLCPQCRVVLSDISEDALNVARENAKRLCVPAEFLAGDLFDAVAGQKFDQIVCNPPYLRADEMEALQMEVRREPALALLGGDDGLLFYRRIARDYKKFLRPGGTLFMEVGVSQARAVCALFSEKSEILEDINGVERVVCVRGK